jgi:outer membrane biosynthesis protein TonB
MKRTIILCALLSLAFQTPQAGHKTEDEPCYCVPVAQNGIPLGDPRTGADTPQACTGLKVAYKTKDVDKRAVLLERLEPAFTQEAKDNNTLGVVRLQAVLCPSGRVSNIKVIKGLPDGLTERAIIAAKGIKFTPAEKDGEKVAQLVVLEYNFMP